MKESIWNGFKRIDFDFEGREAVLVFPDQPDNGKWLYKTEYFGAFPAFELEMVRRGYHLAYLQNHSRWCLPEDIPVKARFCDYLRNTYGLQKQCVMVGMSCGGMHAVYFAAAYPEYAAGLYLDAPVMNLLSCPCGVGDATDEMYAEFVQHTGITKSELINFRHHPIDAADALVQHQIPVYLVCGDSDSTVPYHENGKQLAQMYERAGAPITVTVKPGCGHHPHGLDDVTPLVRFAEQRIRNK